MKIGIIGIGFVGNALYKSFTIKSENNNFNLLIYDKYKNIGNINNLFECNIIFLCLPTLYDFDKKEYNKDSLDEICEILNINNFQGLVVIKSTVEPETTEYFSSKYNLQIIHNPEFLTARTAFEDFHNQKHIIIGLTKSITKENINLISDFYINNYPQATITLCESIESECVKIFCNTFYSVKIQFFSELQQLCQKINCNFSKIRDIMLKNGWINPMHTDIPGPDGQISYGGLCFPKDTNALLSYMKKKNSIHQVLESTINERNQLRDD